MKRNNLQAIVIATLLFGFGVVVGALAYRYYRPPVAIANSPESVRQSVISEMRSKLSLTPTQVDQLQGILDKTRMQMHTIRERNRPEIDAVKQEQVKRVKEILQPNQIALYDKLLADRDRRFREQEARSRRSDHPSH